MTAELAIPTDPNDVINLPPAERGAMVTHALEESKSWLEVATKGTDPTPIAEFKQWAATVAEATRQKGLAKEIQVDAQEMVRRAERGIGLAIRNGQEAGGIARRGQKQTGKEEPGDTRFKSPTDFASNDELWGSDGGIYDLTDGVSDEQFDEAVEQARADENLSRANVIRKVRGQDDLGSQDKGQRALHAAEHMAELAQRALDEQINPGPHAGRWSEPAVRAAKVAGVSPSLVYDAQKALQGVASGAVSEQTIEDIRAGKISPYGIGRSLRGQNLRGQNLRGRTTTAADLEQIGSLVPRGYTSDQIAKELGLSEERVRHLARRNGIEITADKVMGKTRRKIDHTHIVQATITSLEGLVIGLQLLNVNEVDTTDAPYWATSLTESLRELNRLAKQIKEMTQ